MKPNWTQLLVETNRRWIETRDSKDGDRFADVVAAACRDSRQAPHSSDGGGSK